MTRILRVCAIVLGCAIVVTSCASPPAADVDGQAALEKANTDGAGKYAAASFKAAQDSQAALDAELKLQEEKWMKLVRQNQGTRGSRKGGQRQSLG